MDIGTADWVAIAISLGAFFIALVSYARSSAAARAQVYLDFRKRFSDLKAPIPNWYKQREIPKDATEEEKRALELYWQNAFDEWFITQQLQPVYLGKLWKLFYRGIFKGALQLGALRQTVEKLTRDDSEEFGEQRMAFREALDKLCVEADGTRLWEPPRPPERKTATPE